LPLFSSNRDLSLITTNNFEVLFSQKFCWFQQAMQVPLKRNSLHQILNWKWQLGLTFELSLELEYRWVLTCKKSTNL